MILELLPRPMTVCRLHTLADADLSRPFSFLGVTDEEISLVCETAFAPDGAAAREDGWRGLRIAGTLDFSLIGILSGIAAILAANNISIFAVSTFNTDYILVREKDWQRAKNVLSAAGHTLKPL